MSHQMLMPKQLAATCLANALVLYRSKQGNFNHADLKAVRPKLHQHVKCSTIGDNSLDKVYSNIKLGYRAKSFPHLRLLDHLSMLLIPAYASLRNSTPIIRKSVKSWPDGASHQL